MAIKRSLTGRSTQDSGHIENMSFNESAGGLKHFDIGGHLVPIELSGGTFTTDCTTARAIQPGKVLAVYNNAVAVGAITLGKDSSVAALTAGATDANGNVGIPCAPGSWTRIACKDKSFVRTTAATLLVFIVDDETIVLSP